MVCTWCQKWWGLCVKKLIARGVFKIRWLCCLREDTQLECHARRRLWSLQVETDVEHSGPHDYVGQTLRRFDWQHAVLLHFEVISHYANLNGTADQMTLCERGFSCGESKLLWSPVLPLLLQASHPLAFFLSFSLCRASMSLHGLFCRGHGMQRIPSLPSPARLLILSLLLMQFEAVSNILVEITTVNSFRVSSFTLQQG